MAHETLKESAFDIMNALDDVINQKYTDRCRYSVTGAQWDGVLDKTQTYYSILSNAKSNHSLRMIYFI